MLRRLARVGIAFLTCAMLIISACATQAQPANSGATLSYLAAATPSPPIPATGWHTLDTPHFLVHYPPGQEALARQIAVAAEEAHRTLVPKLQYVPEEKTHVVVADISDVANALTSVNPYNKIIVYPAFPDNVSFDTGISARTADWIKQLLLHEYAHVLHLDMHSGSASQVRRMFGKVPWVSTPNALQGTAVIEGYATLMEGTEGWGRGSDTLYDMYLRAASLETHFPTWDQILGDYSLPGWQPGLPTYLMGYSFLDYIANVYGEDKLGEIHRINAAQPYSGARGAFEKALEIKFDQLWQDWQASLVKRYQDQIAQIGETTVAVQADTVGYIALWPQWRPDGKALLYGSSGGVVPALRLRTANSSAIDSGKNDRLVVNGLVERSNGYTWLPDGKRIIYGKLDYNQGRLQSELYLYDLDTRREKRLTSGYRAYAPTASPDGRWVAFLGRRDSISRILVTSTDKVSPLVLWSPDELGYSFEDIPAQPLSLAWSPQGNSIAFAARTKSGRVELYLLPIKWNVQPIAGEPLRLTHDDAIDAQPAWSPDGRYLFFSSDRGGIYNIHVYDTKENRMFQVTRTAGGFFAPAVSPDGKSLAVTSYGADGYSLALIPIQPGTWSKWPVASASAPTIDVAAPVKQAASDHEPISGKASPPPTATLRVDAPSSDLNTFLQAEPAQRNGQDQPKAWELDVARYVDPRDFVVRPYNARESLVPRYWLPIWGGADGAWVTGGSTSATDALGRHSYAVAVSLGGENATYEAGYEYRPGALGAGTVFGLQLTGSRKTTFIDGVEDVAETEMDMSRALSSDIGELYVIRANQGVFSSRQYMLTIREAAGSPRDRSIHAAGWWQKLGGNGLTRRSSILGLQLSQGVSFRPLETTGVIYYVGSQYEPEQYHLSLTTSIGAARRRDSFKINDTAGNWRVRGLPSTGIAGQFAAGATLEGQHVLRHIDHGMSDQPLFFENISAAVFTDMAIMANAGSEPTAVASAGVELRLTTNLGYGAAKNDIRVGLARSVDGKTPWKLYFGIGSGF